MFVIRIRDSVDTDERDVHEVLYARSSRGRKQSVGAVDIDRFGITLGIAGSMDNDVDIRHRVLKPSAVGKVHLDPLGVISGVWRVESLVDHPWTMSASFISPEER
jgi:hypothetical protein